MRHTSEAAPDRARFFAEAERDGVPRVSGTGVFLTAQTERRAGVAGALPARTCTRCRSASCSCTSQFEHTPRVPLAESVVIDEATPGFYRVTVRAGFMERPCLPDRLCEAPATCDLGLDAPDVTYFIGRETFLATEKGEMGRFSESLIRRSYIR